MAVLSKRTIDALEARAAPYIAFDGNLAGFGVRVLEYRPGDGGRGVAKKRLKLGRYGERHSMRPEPLPRRRLAKSRSA